MRRLFTFAPILLGFGTLACGASQQTSYEEAAAEVEDSAAALTADDTDASLDAMDDVAVDTAADEEDGKRADASNADGRGHRGDRWARLTRPRGRGHGIGLLVWYADLDALKVCADLRKACPTSDDRAACRIELRECVRPILRLAFASLCEERVAMCEERDAPKRPCDRIRARCDARLGDGSNEDDSDAGANDGR